MFFKFCQFGSKNCNVSQVMSGVSLLNISTSKMPLAVIQRQSSGTKVGSSHIYFSELAYSLSHILLVSSHISQLYSMVRSEFNCQRTVITTSVFLIRGLNWLRAVAIVRYVTLNHILILLIMYLTLGVCFEVHSLPVLLK